MVEAEVPVAEVVPEVKAEEKADTPDENADENAAENAVAHTVETVAGETDGETGQWHVRSATGVEEGPLSAEQVDERLAAGGIDRECWVWRTGWLDWQRASDVFPELGTSPPSTVPIAAEGAEGFVPEESDVVAAHRRLQQERRQRNRRITLALSALVFFLTVALLVVLLR